MPYIDKIKRKDVERFGPTSSGELNYGIHLWINKYLENVLEVEGHLGYETFNNVLGALEAVKQEFYRRVVGPYENEKIAKNGDVEPYISIYKSLFNYPYSGI